MFDRTELVVCSSATSPIKSYLPQGQSVDACLVCRVEQQVISHAALMNWERRVFGSRRSRSSDDYVKDPPCNHKVKIPKARPKDPSRLALKLAAIYMGRYRNCK